MRITFNSQYHNATSGMNGAAARLEEYQRRVSSGRRIDKPSDDPTGSSLAVGERDQLATVDRYSRSADSVSARLSVVDTVLSDILEKLTAAQTIAASANNTTATQQQRQASAQGLTAIRDGLVDDLNTSVHGSFLFSGAHSTARPYTMTAGTVTAYAGSTREVSVDISEGIAIATSLDGSRIVDAGSSGNVFTVIDNLSAAVLSGNSSAVTAGMDALKSVFNQANGVQSRIGIAIQSVDTERSRLDQLRLAGNTRLADVEGVDMAEAISGMTQAETSYRAALGAAAGAGRISLLDYLK